MPMRFLLPLSAALCLAFALSACDSDSPAPSAPSHPSDQDDGEKPNGTLVVAGKSIPVLVVGTYDDTGMAIAANSNVAGSPDTGWILNMAAKPGKSDLALPLPGKSSSSNGSVHFIDNATLSLCTYALTAGSLHIDSWSERPAYPIGKVAEMSGGATLTLTPDAPSALCSTLSATLAFAKAAASDLF
jgi:hypothetical protein